MPALTNHQSNQSTKLLFIGDSGAGKTGALASLADAGYNLRILDLDNGLDILKNLLTAPGSKYKPESASRVHYCTLTEPMRNVNGRIVPAKATVWPNMVKMLDHWKEPEVDGKPAVDLGKLSSWTEQEVLVLDTLTSASTAAMNFHLSMNGRLGVQAGGNEYRRDIGQAQTMIENLLQLLTDASIKCNVIVNSHVVYVDDQGVMVDPGAQDRPQTGYPSSLGKALSPKIPRYFNTVLQAKASGQGKGTKHKIYTVTQGVVGLKSTNPLRVAAEYELSTGLADYFRAVRASI